jgi:hypothetical protein
VTLNDRFASERYAAAAAAPQGRDQFA